MLGENDVTINTNSTYKYFPSNAHHFSNLISRNDYIKIVHDTEHKINELEKKYILETSHEERR